jgi:hypothetical protein
VIGVQHDERPPAQRPQPVAQSGIDALRQYNGCRVWIAIAAGVRSRPARVPAAPAVRCSVTVDRRRRG